MATYGGLLLLLAFVLLLSRMLMLVFAKGSKQRRESRMKLSALPGPVGLPMIGNLHQLLGSHQHSTLHELSKRYGPLMHLQLGIVPVVVVSSAEMAEEVLKKNDLKVSNRPSSITPLRQLSYDFSDLTFSPYGAMWRELRKISVVSLLNTRKVEGFRRVREEEVERMMATISSLASLSTLVNLSKLLHALSNSIVCRAAFGRGFHNVGEGYSDSKFHRIFAETQALESEFFIADYFPWIGWVDVLTGLRMRLKKNVAELDAFCNEVIEAHINTHRGTLSEEEEDFVDVLLHLQREDSAHLTINHIKGVIGNIFIGGIDTSSATVEYAIAQLIRNPSAMSRAQEEVRGVVGTKGKVKESDISQLKYLKCIVKETLRLHPVIPLIPRETMDNVDINGYIIPPKTRVLVNAWAIGRDSRTWQEPDKFIPERFMDSAIDFKGNDFQLIPFGAGRRICPGMTFGIMTMELALANLLYAFNFEDVKGMGGEGIDMEEGKGLVIHLKNDLQLRATKNKY